jgi:penicillin-binding protein 1A
MAEGGSTITQQLVRHSFLSSEKSWRRKTMEALEAASLGFFGKHASDLDVVEAALLAGLLKAPSTSAPTTNPARALARRNLVLAAMRDTGAIDGATYGSAVRVPVQLSDALPRGEEYGQYFKEEVRQELVKRLGEERLARGGLRVFTTLDLDMQKAAEIEVQQQLDEIDDRRGSSRRQNGGAETEPLQGALIAIDPRCGEIRAMVGGRDFVEHRFNRAVQARRQAGSAFKPFVYAAALERGYTPASLITRLNEPIPTLKGAWEPEDGHQSGGAMTMRAALRTSSNRAAVRMLDDIGIPPVAEYAERLGMGAVPTVPSLALGSGEVTLMSMTAAFGAFANRGHLFPPRSSGASKPSTATFSIRRRRSHAASSARPPRSS